MNLDDWNDAHLEHFLYKEPVWKRALPLLRRLFDKAVIDYLERSGKEK